MMKKNTYPFSLMLTAALGGAVFFGTALFFYFGGFAGKTDEVEDLRGQSEARIVLTDEGFKPERIRIKTGTRVTFTSVRDSKFWPASNVHPSHDIYPEFDPGRPLNSDESWSFIFDKPGSWGMHDHIRSYFTGTIYVEN